MCQPGSQARSAWQKYAAGKMIGIAIYAIASHGVPFEAFTFFGEHGFHDKVSRTRVVRTR